MIKLFTVLFLGFSTLYVSGQSEDDMVNIVARISQTDSVSKVLGYAIEGDSMKRFDYMLPEMVDSEFPLYEFEGFELNLGMSSSDLVNGTPYGKLYVKDFSKKSTELLLLLNGVGDRLKKGEWNYVKYKFQKPKNGKWMIKDVEYFTQEIDAKLLK